ncbi:MAG: hypothetical protein N2110_10405, partial [Flavobacteriales bacterium]|nr:hypothetical protein [Flavobacteriales bacterium]
RLVYDQEVSNVQVFTGIDPITIQGLVAIGSPNGGGSFSIPNSCGGSWLSNATSGIYAPEPAAGCGDEWYIASYPRSGEARTLEIAMKNDADDHIALMPSGNVGIRINNPQEALHVSGNTYMTGASVSQGFSVMEITLQENGNFTAPDNAYHTITCPDGYAMINLAIYASSRLDGGERCNCVKVNDLITANHQWRGHSGMVTSQGSPANTFGTGADNQTHSCSCNSGEVATGFEVYSTDRLDGHMKIRCTQIKSGYSLANDVTTTINGHTVRGIQSAMSVPWNHGRDDQFHFSECPPGTFVTAVVIEASDRLDGGLRCHCSGIKRN